MEKHAQLLTVDRQMLLEFSKQLFTSVSVEGLVQGNITVEVC